MTRTKVPVVPGTPTRITFGYSEAATFLGVAGKERAVVLRQTAYGAMVQILDEDGSPFSFPILAGEAGIYRDTEGWYGYQHETTQEDVHGH